jgi:hypothetical protein
MDLSKFLAGYTVDRDLGAPRTEPGAIVSSAPGGGVPDDVHQVLSAIGGLSFSGGLYRAHRLEDVAAWNATIATGSPETRGRVSCFGYDWLGRQFVKFASMVLQFSAGVLEFTEIPFDLEDFHKNVLLDMQEPALAVAFYKAWLDAGSRAPQYFECIGYKRPLFLGGTDWLENLEAIDLDVYWTVTAPLIARAREVGVGGVIGEIEIGE